VTPVIHSFADPVCNSTSEKLGVFIQSAILDEGHDSSADAKAALDLVKWKVKDDNAKGLHIDDGV
jgi:hypothetical protein